MYSDDEQDMDDDEGSKSILRVVSPPYLLLYEKQEGEVRRQASIDLEVESEEEDESVPHSRALFEGYYPALRFLDSVEAFYTGSLDLTGRHLPRFINLLSRWNAYLTDLLLVCTDTRAFVLSDLKDSRGAPYVDHKFTDDDLWNNFREKWKVPPLFTFRSLLEHTGQVLQTMGQNPVPKIQRLCLIDLPTELLDVVFQHATLDNARILSSTCKQLREIAHRYIFATRVLAFDIPLDLWKSINDVEDPFQYMAKLARSSRESVLSASEFLLGRPDLINRMHCLRISNGWRSSEFEETILDDFSLSNVEENFYDPINRSFVDVLSAGRNLTSVSLYHISVGLDIVRSISQLYNLHTLDMTLCLVQAEVVEALQSGSNDKLSWSTYNLRLLMDDARLWWTLALCPDLRTLSAQSTYPHGMPVPDIDIWTLCRFYPTLERLWLNDVDSFHLPFLAAWLQIGATHNLQLTHFRLLMRSGASDAVVGGVLASLREMPLQVLVIDGLAEGELILFDRIAESFPSLIALTLVRRASNRQRSSGLSMWPLPSWEYARHLASLQNLEHFGWNLYCLFMPATPYGLLHFEDGFPDQIEFRGWASKHDEEFFGRDNWTALLFAAHCPTLRTYTITDRLLTTYRVTRLSDGRVIGELPEGLWKTWNVWNIELWNPSEFVDYCLPILPQSAGESKEGGEYY